ncbi:MAG: ribbon-helix-helix domain-containing protein [Candidatus Woesearchaeota archaeon]|nr:ribbon-helix-helix domain-containing protein [Candidatus Woesearchaeota archaeon]
MTTQMITLKLDSMFLKRIDAAVKENAYQNRTEFIRASLHEKIDPEREAEVRKELESALKEIRKGIKHRKPITDEEFERTRKEVFNESSKKREKDPLYGKKRLEKIPGKFIEEVPRA